MKYRHLKFDSCCELGDYVDLLQTTNRKRPYGDSSTSDHEPEFYGDWSMEQAIKCARQGGSWADGASFMPRVHTAHERLSGAPILTPHIVNDLQGFAPNVPAHLAGTPDSMLYYEGIDAGDTLLKVAVHVGRVADTEQHHVLNRGAAIMAVLDQLSREGYSIELWAIWRNSDDGEGVSVETCIKHSTDFWSPENVAYALAHVSFQRRLCWRVAESIDSEPNATGAKKGAGITSWGYGNGRDVDFSDFHLSYGYVMPSHLQALRNIGTAVDEVKKSTIKQLKEMT